MALVPMQKINLFVHKKDKPKVMSFLQEKGVLHVTNAEAKEDDLEILGYDEETHRLQYKVAELDFAVNFLAKYEEKKKGLQAMIDGTSVKTNSKEIEELVKGYEFQEVVDRCKSVEEEMVRLSNEVKAIHVTQERLQPWSHYKAPLSTPSETESSAVVFLVIPLKNWEEFKNQVINISKLVVIELDNIIGDTVYCEIICEKSLAGEIEGKAISIKGEVVELPELEGTVEEEMENMENRLGKIQERQKQLTQASEELAKDLKSLRISYDFYNWKLIQKEARKNFVSTESTVFISGWMPKKGVDTLKSDLEKVTTNFELVSIDPEEGEDAPVLLQNKGIMKPFESVTNIYGLPLPNELDPTPFLAIFFIVFFGLALTDAVYGLLMFAIMFTVLRYLKIPKQSQGLLRLLMYAGLVTFFAGAIFGGWASLDPSQVPEWMTSTDADGNLVFKFQKISAITNPMAVLILALVLGYVQVLTGVIINFVHKFRTESRKYAIIDQFPWVFILFVIGLMIMVAAGIIPEVLGTPIKYLLYVAIAGIVLTQGREKKNIVLKFLSGVLGLYGLVGYLSDVLSYSRLLALGLATSIIGLAVNTIAGMVNGVPYIGIVLAIIVLIGGHIFNIGINALGAFIHSGRLQFVEFFTKFLEGGGQAFRPLRKESKFVRVSHDE
ncbi:V-type ATP synthase subunit I [Patescibacteria group bacterium]|nr:V-type ATP synthase subunit I [Patescibacteria group bacterium]